MKTAKKPKFDSILSLVTSFPDEETCVQHLIKRVWKNGKPSQCPRCFHKKTYAFSDGKTFKCAKCRRKFNVKTNTIFEDSKLSLRLWYMAIYLQTAHKKGVSSHQLARDLNITQKSAWFMLQRIRYAEKHKSFAMPLEGFVEADETYVGGKAKNKHLNKRLPNTQGRTIVDKTPVFGMIERDGELRAQVVKDVSIATLHPILEENVHPKAKLMTDEWRTYLSLSEKFKNHKIINHGKHQYVDGMIHTNSIENFWSHFKKGIIGIYHQVSPKHLDMYVDEFVFRHNTRKISEYDRFNLMLSETNVRLKYRILISKDGKGKEKGSSKKSGKAKR